MNRAEEAALAWALIDSAPQLLPKAARTRLWIKVGAGDTDSAIVEMLTLYAEGKEELPPELTQTLDDWMRGYHRTDAEPMLRGGLLDRISVRSPTEVDVPAMVDQMRSAHQSRTVPLQVKKA